MARSLPSSNRPEGKGSIALVSLGCAKNAVDLQVRAGNLLKGGCSLASDPDRADTVIVNTCAFIESAREEAESEIRRALALKARGNYGRVVVTGCYPQRYPKAVAAFPGVDEWVGVPKTFEEPQLPGFRLTGKAYAYLRIAEGCNHRCSYCAIPLIRGRYRSRPMDSILKEARELIRTGCRELNIIAQDPMLWKEEQVEGGRSEVERRRKNLVDLLWAIDKLKGDFWVRVLNSYPSEITEDFIIWMMTAKHAVKYVDIPIQHTVPAVLEKMNRGRAAEQSRCAADVLRELVPEITLRTTIMTGFPGETEARFAELMADLKRMQFDHLGAFAYSPEEGTKGAKMRGRPSRETAEARERAVMEQQATIWKLKAKRMLKKTYRALVVAPGVARLESQAPDVDGVVYVDSDAVGEFTQVTLRKVKGFDFLGEIANQDNFKRNPGK